MEWSYNFSAIIQISNHHRSVYEIPTFLYDFLCSRYQLSDTFFYRAIQKDIHFLYFGSSYNW